MRLAGKVAIISGGARGVGGDVPGMGAVEARLFAQEGAKVVIGDILEEEGRMLAAQIVDAGGEAVFVTLDVTREEQWETAVATAVREFGGVSISNGIVWSRDQRTMYYVDTGRNDVRAYDYDLDSGAISNERVTVTNGGSGHFDGMTMDQEGMLWIAIFQGSAVRRYHPESGELLATVDLPMSNVTSCAFGGSDLTDLYITSACLRLSEAEREAQPLAGSLVRVVPGVRGLPAVPYAG